LAALAPWILRRIELQSPAEKVFIISLDGATWDVLRPLMEQGYLPNLRAATERGLSAGLESVIPPVTASAWTSFMTGKNPSKHGIFDFTSFDLQNYRWGINTAQGIQAKTLWQILSEKSKRIVVLNLPYTYPPTAVNGVMVSGWDAPSGQTNFTYPEGIRGRILEMFPDYSSNLWVSEFLPQESEQQFQEFTARLIRGFEQGTGLASHLLESEGWDVFMIHFQQTDWIQHKLWAYIEEGCKNASQKSSRVEAARNCYRRFDELVGQLLKKVEPQHPVTIVLSDHGFGRHLGAIYPNYYLKQWGYYSVQESAGDRLKGAKDFFRESKLAPLRGMYEALAGTKNKIEKRAKSIRSQEHSSWADATTATVGQRGSQIDWSRTKIATVWAYKVAYLFVNMVGRSSQGIVQAGEEYERVVSDVITRFKEVRHPQTGEKLFLRVGRGNEIYPEAQEGIQLPDVVLIPQEGYGFSFSVSDAAPVISNEGGHRPTGVLWMEGKGLRRSVENFHPNLIDLAPTILHLLGLPVPADMDGRVLQEIFPEAQAVRYEEPDNRKVPEAKTEYTTQEAELIEQRLKGLGYVE
jgi:predicted AlkP superfamily phosphohydrolase/phosphomutase